MCIARLLYKIYSRRLKDIMEEKNKLIVRVSHIEEVSFEMFFEGRQGINIAKNVWKRIPDD